MSAQPKELEPDRPLTDNELKAIGLYLPELRRSISDQSILNTSLVIAFVLGLVAHISGYLLRSTATTVLVGLIADLLYALGWALWTGVVVAVFVQVIPEAKRRQVKRALDEYDLARSDRENSAIE
jgi:predicted lysophospholipase L1 biosynthesis ABC-type transport system permease subunit